MAFYEDLPVGTLRAERIYLNGTEMTSSAAELAYLDITAAGTAQASKAVVLDENKDVAEIRNLTSTNHIVGVGGTINADSGTVTETGGAATLSKMAGVVTSEALTTAAAASYTLTLTNTVVAATDLVFVSVQNGTNTQGIPLVSTVTPGSESVVIVINNQHATDAFNGTIKISFLVVKA
jgi:hypothetical protein